MTIVQIIRMAIPYVIGVFVYSVSLSGARYTFQETWFFRHGPGGTVPWYFIGQDLVGAMWSIPSFLALLAFSVLAARKLGPSVWVAFALAVISLSDSICEGVNIALHTRHVWDPATAASTWTSFETYIQSQDIAYTVSMVVMAPILLWCFVLYARDLKARGAT